ncbi:MAG TPA: hypothetical protein VGS22_29360 [Thermoanaerobaculia bacterium]|nr:hypothetical protein [Thermoanaerobaculia bacterium]
MKPKTLTLTGCLGKDRDVRYTRPKTTVLTVRNEVIDGDEEIEVTTPPREYLRLSLAVRERGAKGWETRWVNLIVWDLRLTAVAGVPLSRTGDRVRITGTEETFTFTTETGEEREFHYVSVRSFQRLQLRVRERAEAS